ncbi:MAG: nuclear transport factor 2 family protein [Deltaproteobacteria bacterium]|nr:nuclear transport factor 2 family protein [Deltaproteobacteria bacterium]
MSEEEKLVSRANEDFYRAFESLDIKRMESVWAHDEAIECGHPGWLILRGRKAVMESWRSIFENTAEIHFLLSEVTVHIQDNVAWVTLYENLSSAVGEQNVSAMVLTTNIFKKIDEGWRMIHHHGSSVAQPPSEDSGPTVH